MKKLSTPDMIKIALCIAILTVSSYLVVPLPFTPVVLSVHTITVSVVGLILKPQHAAYTIVIYLVMGLAGLPVFAGGSAGASKLFGPTGGFYFGFLFAAVAVSLVKGKKINVFRYAAVTIAIGMPIQHLFATLFMLFHNGMNLKAALVTASVPFIPGDIIKCVIASLCAAALNKTLKN